MSRNGNQWFRFAVLAAYLPLVVPFPLVFASLAAENDRASRQSEPETTIRCDCCVKSVQPCSARMAANFLDPLTESPPVPTGKCPCPLCPEDGQQSDTCICFACANFIDIAVRHVAFSQSSTYASDVPSISGSKQSPLDLWRPPRV